MIATCWKCKNTVDSENVDLEETVGLCEDCYTNYGREEEKPGDWATVAGMDMAAGKEETHMVVLDGAKPCVTANITQLEESLQVKMGRFAEQMSEIVTLAMNAVAQGVWTPEDAKKEIRKASVDLLYKSLPPNMPKIPTEVVEQIVDECMQVHITARASATV